MEQPEWLEHVERESDTLVRMRRHGGMVGDAMLVADEEHWLAQSDDRAPGQLRDSAHLPGMLGEAWAMPDWHFGYGFPIGCVIATDVDGEGGISPGGVGFDINCGVRLVKTELTLSDIPDQHALGRRLAREIPAGASGRGGVQISESQLSEILSSGAEGATDIGWGESRDLQNIESKGILEVEEPAISERALARGMRQLGTLGSGNHFLELQTVERIVDEETAAAYGLREDQLVAMIHSGSRGLGHQVCTDHLRVLESGYRKRGSGWEHREWEIFLPDRQLAAAPLHSPEGEAYIQSMQAAGNFAFANRSALTQRLRKALRHELGGADADVEVLYDVSHNIAKFEQHVVHGRSCQCCVHRKGATRALPGDHPELAGRFAGIGQPVLVPGDMGTSSWVLAGPREGANAAFNSSCHGAGRRLSRTQARKTIDAEALLDRLTRQGISVHARTPNVLAEEAPEAYKDVDHVVDLTDRAGLARPVARLKPLIVIKG